MSINVNNDVLLRALKILISYISDNSQLAKFKCCSNGLLMTTEAISPDALLAIVLWLMSKNIKNDSALLRVLTITVVYNSDNSQFDKFKYSSNGLVAIAAASSFAALSVTVL